MAKSTKATRAKMTKRQRAVESHNRKVRDQARRKVLNRLTKQMGSKEKASRFLKGKHVHHTGRGLEVRDNDSAHGKHHGRGNKGPKGVYKRKPK